jgi:hypothetical protein
MMGEEFAGPLPGKMNYTLDRDILVKIKDNAFQFLVEKKNKSKRNYKMPMTENDRAHNSSYA